MIYLSKEELYKLIKINDWKSISTSLSPEKLVEMFCFQECMSLAYDLFFENFHDDEIQNFAMQVFFSIQIKHPLEWNSDWKNDAFLGQLCGLRWRYDERYECYKKAYEKLIDPPDSLLLLLAGCNNAPGTPPINDHESEGYVIQALEKRMTYEAALMMKEVSRNKCDLNQEAYWDKTSKELKNRNIHTEDIIPEALKFKIKK